MNYPTPEDLGTELLETQATPLNQGVSKSVYSNQYSLSSELEDKPTSPIIIVRPQLVGFNSQRHQTLRDELNERSEGGIILLPHQILRGLIYRRLQQIREELGIEVDAFDPFSVPYEHAEEFLDEAPKERLEDENALGNFPLGPLPPGMNIPKIKNPNYNNIIPNLDKIIKKDYFNNNLNYIKKFDYKIINENIIKEKIYFKENKIFNDDFSKLDDLLGNGNNSLEDLLLKKGLGDLSSFYDILGGKKKK